MNSPILVLDRTSQNESSMFGVLSNVRKGRYKDPICNIIENKWDNNKQDVSCIPPGFYTIVRGTTQARTIDGSTFVIMGVPKRTYIKFHIGNTHLDTLGCPLTVSCFGRLTINGGSILGGYGSKIAFGKFMQFMKNCDEATLLIQGELN